MKIGVIFPTFWPLNLDIHKVYGGLEPRTAAVVKYLADDENDVRIFAPRGSTFPYKNVKLYSGDFHCWNGRDPSPYILEKNLIESNIDILKDCDIILEDNHFGFCRWLKSLDVESWPNIVFSWDHHPDNIQSLPNYPQRIITVSKWTMTALREKFKHGDHMFWHAYSGLIRDNYPIDIDIHDKDSDLYLFLARISGVKGPDIVIELAKEFKDDKFVIMGDTLFTNEPFLARLVKNQADEMDNVTVLFNASYKEKIHYLRQAKGLLHPGRWDEPLGWDMLEGLYFGSPVLAYDRGSIREIYNHDTHGMIVPMGNNDTETVELYKRSFRRYRSKQYDPEICRQRILDIFDFKRFSYPVYREILTGIKNPNPIK